MNYVYILKCADDTLYTGWTTNLDSRVKQHNSGRGAKYTRGRTPVEIVYFEGFSQKGEALKREYAIKKLSRYEKIKLIDNKNVKAKE